MPARLRKRASTIELEDPVVLLSALIVRDFTTMRAFVSFTTSSREAVKFPDVKATETLAAENRVAQTEVLHVSADED